MGNKLITNRIPPLHQRLIAIALLVAITWAKPTAAQDSGDGATPAPETQLKQSVCVVIGAAGAEVYGEMFQQWAKQWQSAANRAGADFTLVGADPGPDKSDRERLQQWIQSQANRQQDLVWLVFIGHGTYNNQAAKFNLRGKDVSGKELAEWLKTMPDELVIIDCASSSGPWINALSASNRVVVTATQSGDEVNFARFGKYLAEAITSPQQADLDKDDQVSLLEAFCTASNGVAEFYQTDNRLATEHALLDDNGDARGTPSSFYRGLRPATSSSDRTPIDGFRARQIHLIPSEREAALPREVREQRDKLELAMAELRARKDMLSEDDYYKELEALALELARLYQSAPTP